MDAAGESAYHLAEWYLPELTEQSVDDMVARLDAASAVTKAYPYWHQAGFAERNPFPV